MYSSIGGKLKGVAVFLAIVGALASIIAGVSILNQGSSYYNSASLNVSGWIVIIGGCISSWISSMLMYGFGELIENTQAIQEILRKQQRTAIPHQGGVENSRKPWACSNCGYVNVGNTNQCAKCGKR